MADTISQGGGSRGQGGAEGLLRETGPQEGAPGSQLAFGWSGSPEIRERRQISSGQVPLLAQDPRPPSPLHLPAASSLHSKKPSEDPVTLILRDAWTWSPRRGAGVVGRLPASSGLRCDPSPLKWELRPRGRRAGVTGVLMFPPTHIPQLHTYLGGISGPGGTPWGQPRKGAPWSRVCVWALKRCAPSATHLCSHPSPRGQEMSPHPQP